MEIQVQSEYFTRPEAARYLRVGQRVFDGLTAKGKIIGARIGGSRLIFRRQDLDDYVVKQLRKAAR